VLRKIGLQEAIVLLLLYFKLSEGLMASGSLDEWKMWRPLLPAPPYLLLSSENVFEFRIVL